MPKLWFRVVNLTTTATGEDGAPERRARLDIFDQIGESTDWWTAETGGIAALDFSTSLLALSELDVIELHINSPGVSIVGGGQIFRARAARHHRRVHRVRGAGPVPGAGRTLRQRRRPDHPEPGDRETFRLINLPTEFSVQAHEVQGQRVRHDPARVHRDARRPQAGQGADPLERIRGLVLTLVAMAPGGA
jgi:hypothetical protein